MLPLPADHARRRELSAEVHARPFMHLEPSERLSHLALLTGEGGIEAERGHLAALCQRYAAPPPPAAANFHLADLGVFRLRWERHTEFATYTFFVREPVPAREDGRRVRFLQPVIARVPHDWLADLPGELLAAVHLELEGADAPPLESEDVPAVLAADNFAGSLVSGGAATVWMNFAINDDGFGRVVVRSHALKPRQAGRLVQRLLEIETYRMMALLALPLARSGAPRLTEIGERLTGLTRSLADDRRDEDGRALLGRLTDLSAEIEQLAAATSYRFGAARAYHALVQRRIAELREGRIEGQQTIEEFMERRLSPAMRTCEAAGERLEALSQRVARASQLLRTRIDVELAAQNRDLLRSMDRRATLQLRLQETVEGLSVAAITYYAVGLFGYLVKGGKAGGLPLPAETLTAVAVPLVAAAVWIGMRRGRRALEDAG